MNFFFEIFYRNRFKNCTVEIRQGALYPEFSSFYFLVLFSGLDQKGSGCRDQCCEKCSGVSRQRSVLKGKLRTQLMQVGDA